MVQERGIATQAQMQRGAADIGGDRLARRAVAQIAVEHQHQLQARRQGFLHAQAAFEMQGAARYRDERRSNGEAPVGPGTGGRRRGGQEIVPSRRMRLNIITTISLQKALIAYIEHDLWMRAGNAFAYIIQHNHELDQR